jgi:hypothetical protein
VIAGFYTMVSCSRCLETAYTRPDEDTVLAFVLELQKLRDKQEVAG